MHYLRKNIIPFLLGALLLGSISIANAFPVYQVIQGGTGTSTFSGGGVIFSNGTSSPLYAIATSSLGLGVSGGINGYQARWTGPTTLSTGIELDNGTVGGVNATTSTTTFNVQGNAGTSNILRVASSSNADALVVTSLGNVAIASSSALARLDVYGAPGVMALRVSSSSNLSFLEIESTGNVGISTTTALARLDVFGTLGSNQNILAISSSTATGFTQIMNVAASGNVGIGSTTPFAKLSIIGDTNPTAGQNAPDALVVVGGTGPTSAGTGGGIRLTGGGVLGSSPAGSINLTGGSGNPNGAGGAINITGGSGGSGGAGSLVFAAGTALVNSGNIGGLGTIQGGTGGTSAGSGGQGGPISLFGGTGGSGSSVGKGGNAYFYGGSPSSGTLVANYGRAVLGMNSSGNYNGDVSVGTTTSVLPFNIAVQTAYLQRMVNGNYTIATSSDIIITESSTTIASAITLPYCVAGLTYTTAANGNQSLSAAYTIKDGGGNAATNNITITAKSGDTIDGASTKVISTNFSAFDVYCSTSTKWLLK